MRIACTVLAFVFAAAVPAQTAGSYSTFGKGCSGQTRDPQLFALNLPFVGRTFTQVVNHVRSNSPGVLIVGDSDQRGPGYPLPLNLRFLNAPNCNLLVSVIYMIPFQSGNGAAVLRANIPNRASLAGTTWFQQVLTADPASNPQGWALSNAAKAKIGSCPCGPPQSITEDFQSDRQLDTRVSAGKWGGGQALPPRIGGTGVLGSFNVLAGTKDPKNANRYVWNTDRMTIPGKYTPNGKDILVAGGVFEFTDFHLKAGDILAFVGSRPAQIRVRGDARIEGTIDGDAPDATFFGAAPQPGNPQRNGQPGTRGSLGGGAGGQGGDSCDNKAPNARYNGRPGQTVHLPSGNGYRTQAAVTGGKGSPHFPASGKNTDFCALTGVFCGVVGAGGGGGGFFAKGADGVVTRNPCRKTGNSGSAPNSGGGAFDLGGLINTNTGPNKSLNFYSVGGSGGGGGGSHPLLTRRFPFDRWLPGSAGAPGAGVIGLRVGHDLVMTSTGRIQVRGGDGYVIDAVKRGAHEPTDNLFNVPTPGGAGSGGTIVAQVEGKATMQGRLDTSGGKGGVLDNTPTNQVALLAKAQGGDGSPGYYRLETLAGPKVAEIGAGIPAATAKNGGQLIDFETRTVSQSRFYSTGSAIVPTYIRYVIEATVGGVRRVYSDDATWNDPNFAGLAGPTGPLWFQVQGAQIDVVTGNVKPNTLGPWRDYVFSRVQQSLDDDNVNGWRFRLIYDTTTAAVVVKKVTVWFQW